MAIHKRMQCGCFLLLIGVFSPDVSPTPALEKMEGRGHTPYCSLHTDVHLIHVYSTLQLLSNYRLGSSRTYG